MRLLYFLISFLILAQGCLAIQYGKFSTDASGQDQKLVTTMATRRGTSNVLMGGHCHITAAHNVWNANRSTIQVYDTYKDPINGRWRVNNTLRRVPDRVLIHPLFDGSIDCPYDVALLGFDEPWESAGTHLVMKRFNPQEYLKFRGWGLNEVQGIPTFLSQGSAFVSTHENPQCNWESLLGVCIRAPYGGKRGLACSGDSGACVYSGTQQCKGIIITSHSYLKSGCGNYTSNGVVDFENATVKGWLDNVLMDCILDGAAPDDSSYYSYP